jgi:arylsulfatase A-like enzyme
MPTAPSGQDRPNIIWVFADQMRGQAMGCAGDPNVRTPNLDALAAGGVRFNAACATYPVCVPFRFTLLTGEYAHTRWIPAIHWQMSPAERTISHEFNDAGYETAYVGKWHLNGSIPLRGGGPARNRNPIPRPYRGGFEVWHGFSLRNDFYDTCCFHGDDPTPAPLGKYQTDGLFDIALDYLRARKPGDRPCFLTLSLEAPHPPHQAPPEYIERVRARTMQWRPNFHAGDPARMTPETPWDVLQAKDIPDLPIRYYAQIENLDDNLGRLVAALRASGQWQNTLLFFFSDHGEMLGSHGLYQKQLPYEESVNIPFILHDPRLPAARRGAVIEDPVCTEDFLPTTLALVGLRARGPKPGLDLTDCIRAGVPLPREGVYLEFVEEDRPSMVFFGMAWRGLRTRRHKYTVLDGKPWQLFDLAQDPYEQANLLASPAHEATRRRLHAELRRIAAATQDCYPFAE